MSKIRDHVSYSEFQVWNACEWKWMRDCREERRSNVYSVYMMFGTGLHKAFESLKNPEVAIADRPTPQKAFEIFEESFRKEYERDEDKIQEEKRVTKENIDEFVKAGKRIIDSLASFDELNNAKVMFVEYPLLEKIDRVDDIEIKFKGYIDLVIMTKDKKNKKLIYICDYKTTSWGWGVEKKNDDDLKMQLRLYKHFFSKKFNIDPNQVKTAFILLKRNPQKKSQIEWLPFSSGNKTTMRAVLKLNESITGMHSNDYSKNRSNCINEYGDKCPYYKSQLCLEDD